MNNSVTRPHARFRSAFILVGGVGLLYLLLNLFTIGGDEFVYNLNSILVSPLAIITAAAAAMLWRQMKTGAHSRVLWGGMLLGWILWAVAETLWTYYSIKGEDPFPSPADFFFLAGYIPLLIGFLSRLWRLPGKPNTAQRILYGSISLAVISATTYLILFPIVQEYDPQRLVESLLGLFYPLADLLLLLLGLRLLFTYASGDYGIGWRLILFGFITITISDLFFSYADWNSLYYPDSEATLLSTVGVDWLYNISYMLWALGIYILRILLSEYQILKIAYEPALVPNAYVLLFVNKHEQVIDVSQNYYYLISGREVRYRSLADVLGLTVEHGSLIHENLSTQGKFLEECFRITDISGVEQDAWFSGLAIINPPHDYSGAVTVLRMFSQDERQTNIVLSEYQKSLVSNVLTKCDSHEQNEIKRFLWEYHLIYIKSLYNLAFHEGGAAMSQSLLDELENVSKWYGWGLDFTPQTIVDDSSMAYLDLPLDVMPILLETSRHFATRLTDETTVDTVLHEAYSQFSEAVQAEVARFGKPVINRSS